MSSNEWSEPLSKIVSHINDAGSILVNINNFHKATDNESCFIYHGHGVRRFANFFDAQGQVNELSYNRLK